MKSQIMLIKNQISEEYLYKIGLFIFWLGFLIWGILSYKDYGITYDEVLQRTHGLINFKYVYENLVGTETMPNYLANIPVTLEEYGFFKYYGVGIKIPLIIIEYLMGFKMTNEQIFHMNHLYTFLLFYISSIFVYKIIKKLRMNNKYAIFAVIIYCLCPRILADSFYNIKDSVFSSLFVIMLYFGLSLMEEFQIRNAIGLIVSAAFCLNTRIIGALPLLIMCLVYVFKGQREKIFHRLKQMIIIGIFSFGIYIIIAPAAWGNVLDYICNVLGVFGNFDADGVEVLGNVSYSVQNLPWYYLPACMFMTLPNLYIILGIAGVITEIRKYLVSDSINEAIRSNYIIVTLFAQFFCVLLYDMIIRPPKYNLWRHFYFLFIYIVIFSVIGLKNIIIKFSNYRKWIIGCTFFSILLTAVWILKNHPYQYMYYNMAITEDSEDEMKHDYWHASYHNILQRIINDTNINVYANIEPESMYFGENNWENYHLNNHQYSSEYYVTWKKEKSNLLYEEVDRIEVDKRIASILYKRKNYDNCIGKYYLIGDNIIGDDESIKWETWSEGQENVIKAHFSKHYFFRQIDFFTNEENILSNIKVYASQNGTNWYRYDSTTHVFNKGDMFSIISSEDLPENIMIRYEMNKPEAKFNWTIKSYGVKKAEIKYLESNINSKDLKYALDGNEESRWTSMEYQKTGMYIDIKLETLTKIKGLALQLGTSELDFPRDLSIQYKNEDDIYENIVYKTNDSEYFKFDSMICTDTLRIVNLADCKSNYWSIAELWVEIDENVKWTNQDTQKLVKTIKTPQNNSLCNKMIDNDFDSYWYSDIYENQESYIEVQLQFKTDIKGFAMYESKAIENAQIIEIYGSDDGKQWNKIPYHYGAAMEYIFNQAQCYSNYRIYQYALGNSKTWSITELGILTIE